MSMEYLYKYLSKYKYDLIIILVNILLFMIFVTIFYIFYISDEFERIILEKYHIVKSFLKKDPDYKDWFNNYEQNYINENSDIVDVQKKIRDEKNFKLILIHCIVPIIVTFVLLILLLFFVHSNKSMSRGHIYTLFYVVLAFLMEIYLFFFVIKKYQHFGNIDVICKIYKELI